MTRRMQFGKLCACACKFTTLSSRRIGTFFRPQCIAGKNHALPPPLTLFVTSYTCSCIAYAKINDYPSSLIIEAMFLFLGENTE